jgi:uncharacterized membrane protein YdjX (TVP38/TMEM64 family)
MALAFPSRHDRRAGWLIAALVAALIVGLASIGAADPHRVAASLVAAKGWAGEHLAVSALAYAALYVAFAALSLPGAWTMSVAGGALFGPWIGVPLVSFSSTLGATVAMLMARNFFRDAVEARFPDFVARVNRGVARDGARYLFAARLTPLVPFFAVNLGVGLTRMRVSTFVLVTLVGALPIVILYVAAGQQFASIAAPQDILSARIVVALIALAAAPFAAKGLGAWRESRAALAAWPRPRR